MEQQQILYELISFLGFTIISDIVQPMLELWFLGHFSDKKVKVRHYTLYILLSLVISVIERSLPSVPLSPLLLTVRTAILWGEGTIFFKCPASVCLLSAIIAKTVTLLSAGITASILFLTAPSVVANIFKETALGGILLGVSGQLFTVVLIAAFYQIIIRKFKWKGTLPNQYLTVFFLPVLMVLMVEQYIFNQVYGNEIIIEGVKIIEPAADHLQVLLIQLFACFSLFSALYACRRLSEDVANRTRLLLLEQESAAQKAYLEESRIRYEQTRSFRHDIKHHFLTLSGLLEQGELETAKGYLRKLETVSETLSFPCNTGNTVVDIVLGSKLSAARQNGIQAECLVKLPSPCSVDELDLCILFANAVDNAVHACKDVEYEKRFLRILGRQKGDFFMIEFENSCQSNGTYKKGIGLNNIETVAEKYHGAVTARMEEDCFRLHVLLVF